MSDVMIPCSRCGTIQRLDVEGPRVTPEACICGNPNNPPERPDWLWTGEGIDRIYAASDMSDANDALDEIKSYIEYLEG